MLFAQYFSCGKWMQKEASTSLCVLMLLHASHSNHTAERLTTTPGQISHPAFLPSPLPCQNSGQNLRGAAAAAAAAVAAAAAAAATIKI